MQNIPTIILTRSIRYRRIYSFFFLFQFIRNLSSIFGEISTHFDDIHTSNIAGEISHSAVYNQSACDRDYSLSFRSLSLSVSRFTLVCWEKDTKSQNYKSSKFHMTTPTWHFDFDSVYFGLCFAVFPLADIFQKVFHVVRICSVCIGARLWKCRWFMLIQLME